MLCCSFPPEQTAYFDGHSTISDLLGIFIGACCPIRVSYLLVGSCSGRRLLCKSEYFCQSSREVSRSFLSTSGDTLLLIFNLCILPNRAAFQCGEGFCYSCQVGNSVRAAF